MTVSIRSLAPEEWTIYRAVRLAALQDTPEAFGGSYEAAAAYPDQQWIDWCSLPSWFAFDDAEPIGMVRVMRNEHKALPELVSMWVSPDARGGDVATRLVQEVINWVAAQGDRGVYLGAITENVRAIRLYERLGFFPNGISHQLPDGRIEIELEYRLEPLPAHKH